MDRSNIKSLLTGYRENRARAAHIETRLSEIAPLMEELMRHAAYYLTTTTPAYTEGTGGGKVESSVEKLAVALADGRYTGELGELDRERRALTEELSQRRTAVRYVDSWMMALSEREAFVIGEHLLGCRTWRETGRAFEEKFGEDFTREGLKALCKRGLEKIFRIAE